MRTMTKPEAIQYLSQHIKWRRQDNVEYVPFKYVKQAIELSGYTSDILENYVDYVSSTDRWRGNAGSLGGELDNCLRELKEL